MTSSPQPAAKRPKKDRALLESIPTPSTTANSKFTRSLGSADPLTRKKAVTALQRWLELRSEVAEADLIVIWKGLFYCFWHSDLVPVQVRANHHPVCRPHSVAQEELASQLASILQHVKPAVCAVLRGSAMQHPSQVAYAYFSACMTTLRREWFGIDRHRIDKFLNLIREFVYHLFLMLHDAKWYGVDNVYNTLVMAALHSITGNTHLWRSICISSSRKCCCQTTRSLPKASPFKWQTCGSQSWCARLDQHNACRERCCNVCCIRLCRRWPCRAAPPCYHASRTLVARTHA